MSNSSYFAKAQRSSGPQIEAELQQINASPLVDGLMKAVHGLVTILDKNRQIISINTAMMTKLGINNVKEVLGLRLGEAIRCVHSHDMPAGCGTSRYCASCGAAIAIVACTEQNKAEDERICAATVLRHDQQVELCLRVHCSRLAINDQNFYLLFLQDITQQQAWAAMERVFFHDISNLLSGIVGTSDLLMLDKTDTKLIDRLGQLIPRLQNEIELQRSLSHTAAQTAYAPSLTKIGANQILTELQNVFTDHQAAKNKNLLIVAPDQDYPLRTDCTLIMRVLTNMVINALEASGPEETVKVWLSTEARNLTFQVWNPATIPEKIRPRIFQRHFSTKTGQGRGLGTYSMKLFGETFLGGKVDFTSTASQGTTFHLTIPWQGS